ncbi:MAG: type II toxin-antitoxin system VapC family toxin [Actinomycetota bacterium]|nr:type II toxin-antitoxin system VapC family toxin [Actinomycetota bacterium]
MRFWDTSAVIPLISEEATSDVVSDLLHEDREITVWWGTWVECSVAISRLSREGSLDVESEEEARASLDLLAEDWREVQPTDEVRSLSAAFVWRESTDEDLGFVCLDDRLRQAATDEGFEMLPMETE